MKLQNMSRKLKYLVAVIGILLLAPIVWLSAAILAEPDEVSLNYVAGPALSTAALSTNTVVAYYPWFDQDKWTGDLIARPVSITGTVSATPNWNAQAVFATKEVPTPATSPYWNTGRIIITTNGGYSGWTGNKPNAAGKIAFRWASLDATNQQPQLTLDQLDYVRGKRALESQYGGTLRNRDTILGDIIHSNPVYVGKSNQLYNFDAYSSFISTNSSRLARVYVGANDGTLHAFNASTTGTAGEEVFAYVPSMLIPTLNSLSNPTSHTYYVDGWISVGDAYINTTGSNAWHTILVGGLGGGGKGYYALDITSATVGTEAATANAKILWELGAPGTAADNDLGLSYSRPSIVRLNNDRWVAITGNGYDSTSGAAVLYIIDLETGYPTKIVADNNASGGAADKNGLSSPALIDVNGDFKVDYAYAGDMNGNLWRFNLTGITTVPATASNGPVTVAETSVFKLFENDTSVARPITVVPDVTKLASGDRMIFFATGRAFNAADNSATSTNHYVYGIVERFQTTTTGPTAQLVKHGDTGLIEQTMSADITTGTEVVRTMASNNAVNLSTDKGWKTKLRTAGQRVLGHIQVRSGRVQFAVSNPSSDPDKNWMAQLDYRTGSTPKASAFSVFKAVFDIDANGVIDNNDLVNGLSTSNFVDVPVMWRFFINTTPATPVQLIAQPVFAQVSSGQEVMLINQVGMNTVCRINCTGGLAGGHIDVDTDSPTGGDQTNNSDRGLGGKTVAHEHEYDDKYNVVFVDYFSLEPIPPRKKLNRVKEVFYIDGFTGTSSKGGTADLTELDDRRFIIVLANADLSPGGDLVISDKAGGYTTTNVVTYQNTMRNKVLAGTLQVSDTYTIRELGIGPSNAVTLLGNDTLVPPITGGLRIAFDAQSIITGDLIGSNTKCVRSEGIPETYAHTGTTVALADNKHITGTDRRWRNGALTMHLLEVSVAGTTVTPMFNYYDQGAGKGIRALLTTGTDPDPTQGRTQITTTPESGFLYESTLFWHWEGETRVLEAFTVAYLLFEDSGGTLALRNGTGQDDGIFEIPLSGKAPCYGDPYYNKVKGYVENGVNAADLTRLDTEITRLETACAVTGGCPIGTQQPRLDALRSARTALATPVTPPPAGGGGVVQLTPRTQTPGTSVSPGIKSWNELTPK